MKHFSKIPIATGERSKQNLSATTYLTMDFGRLDPLYHTEVCPGDDIELDVSQFMRAAPMPYPVHGNIRHDVRVFFVPYRILQPDDAPFSWNDYITGVSNQSHPYIELSRYAEFLNVMSYNTLDSDGFPLGVYQNAMLQRDARRLFATLGLPQIVYNSTTNTETMLGYTSTLWPLQAYQRIWWDYYRNSELISEQLKSVYLPYLYPGSNIIDTSSTNGKVHRYLMPRYSCFAKDYFTTSKLNPQSGESASSVGSAGDITLNYDQSTVADNSYVGVGFARNYSGINGLTLTQRRDTTIGTDVVPVQSARPFTSLGLSSDSSFTIEIFRKANALQKYLERNNIVGSRLIERFLARFGVAPSAQKLQMSEYLGGSSGTYNIGAVMSSTDTAAQAGSAISPADGFGMSINQSDTGGSIQGLSTGAGALNINSGKIKYHAKEFGCLMVIGTIVPHVVYTQGLHRKWRRGIVDRFDYLTPEFDRLGYEAVSTSERNLQNDRTHNYYQGK